MATKGHLFDNGMCVKRKDLTLSDIKDFPKRLGAATLKTISIDNDPKITAGKILKFTGVEIIPRLVKNETRHNILYDLTSEKYTISGTIDTVVETYVSVEKVNTDVKMFFYILTFSFDYTDPDYTVIDASKEEFSVSLTIDT